MDDDLFNELVKSVKEFNNTKPGIYMTPSMRDEMRSPGRKKLQEMKIRLTTHGRFEFKHIPVEICNSDDYLDSISVLNDNEVDGWMFCGTRSTDEDLKVILAFERSVPWTEEEKEEARQYIAKYEMIPMEGSQ